MKRRSLHIGLNRLDPGRWGGWDGALSGCVSDAEAMRDVARQRGFRTRLLRNEDATVEALHRNLKASGDGPEHGAFTQGFLDVWGDGDYRGNYDQLRRDVDQAIGLEDQTPQIFSYGRRVADMIAQIPLSDEEA